ncbi:hypothetical protein BDL97_08G130200 [Sphagnum fallax]|nr:hypothetical protein BDL97_08G130200 [Sphagnum fallax]
MSICTKVTSIGLLGVLVFGSTCLYDNFLIFQQCSRKALEKAAHDTQLKKILGENIEIGDWYESTIGVDHEGHSAYCNFPVKGSLNNANIHLRAVRFEDRRDSYFEWPGSGRWELVVLEALVHPGPSESAQCPRRIDLHATEIIHPKW